MGFPSPSRERMFSKLTADHEFRHARSACNECLSPIPKFLAVLYLCDVSLHILRAPAP